MEIDNIKNIEEKIKKIKLLNIMSRHAITTTPYTPIVDVAHLLMRFKVSGVPVVDNDKKMIGIVTATDLFDVMQDIVNTLDIKDKKQGDYPLFVKDIMTREVYSLDEESSLYEALRLMCKENIHTLPVTSGGKLCGIVGRRDVLFSFYG